MSAMRVTARKRGGIEMGGGDHGQKVKAFGGTFDPVTSWVYNILLFWSAS